MKILAAIPSLLLLLVKTRARDPGDPLVHNYTDTCNYAGDGDNHKEMCGDLCIGRYDNCYCGTDNIRDTFRPFDNNKDNVHCCGESCTLGTDVPVCNVHKGERCKWIKGDCRQGRKLSMSSPCNTTMGVRCYNSYLHSLVIGDKSHYTCPETCVSWEAMCRGVSHCEGDHQVCGPDLRCPPPYWDTQARQFVTIKAISPNPPSLAIITVLSIQKLMMENLTQSTDLTRHMSELLSLREIWTSPRSSNVLALTLLMG